jgi:hypothetical protein
MVLKLQLLDLPKSKLSLITVRNQTLPRHSVAVGDPDFLESETPILQEIEMKKNVPQNRN